jgi:hypothetical protein
MILFASSKHLQETKYSLKQTKHYELSIEYQSLVFSSFIGTKFSDDSYTSRESLAPSDMFPKFLAKIIYIHKFITKVVVLNKARPYLPDLIPFERSKAC